MEWRGVIALGNVYTTRICSMCGKQFRGHIRAKYCDSCRPEAKKISNRRHKAKRKTGDVRPLGSVDQCARCGKDYIVNGGLQRYCPECAPIAFKEVDNAQSRAWNAANPDAIRRSKQREKEKPKELCYIVCPICGKTFGRTYKHRKYCSSDCQKAGAREHDRQRRAKKSEK